MTSIYNAKPERKHNIPNIPPSPSLIEIVNPGFVKNYLTRIGCYLYLLIKLLKVFLKITLMYTFVETVRSSFKNKGS